MVLLLATPFIDRRAERRISKRPFALSMAILVFIGLAWLTYQGETGTAPTSSATSITFTGITPGSAAAAGETLFLTEGCTSCHMVKGVGGQVGPNLTTTGTQEQVGHLRRQAPGPGPGRDRADLHRRELVHPAHPVPDVRHAGVRACRRSRTSPRRSISNWRHSSPGWARPISRCGRVTDRRDEARMTPGLTCLAPGRRAAAPTGRIRGGPQLRSATGGLAIGGGDADLPRSDRRQRRGVRHDRPAGADRCRLRGGPVREPQRRPRDQPRAPARRTPGAAGPRRGGPRVRRASRQPRPARSRSSGSTT